jgi:hypothetical protein
VVPIRLIFGMKAMLTFLKHNKYIPYILISFPVIMGLFSNLYGKNTISDLLIGRFDFYMNNLIYFIFPLLGITLLSFQTNNTKTFKGFLGWKSMKWQGKTIIIFVIYSLIVLLIMALLKVFVVK